MVETRFAFVFGIFFAIGVSFLSKNYFESFEYSLLTIFKGKENILKELEKFPIELLQSKERINNNYGTEWENIVVTGSPIYNI
jgi:hypothetical protein